MKWLNPLTLLPTLFATPLAQRNARGISGTYDASGGIAKHQDGHFLSGRGKQYELQLHWLNDEQLLSWQSPAGQFSNVRMSLQSDYLTLAYRKDSQSYLAYTDVSQLGISQSGALQGGNLSLAQWQVSQDEHCQTTITRLTPYEGDVTRVVVEGKDECSGRPTSWSGVFDRQSETLVEQRQLSAHNYQGSVYALHRELHVIISSDNNDIDIYHQKTGKKDSYRAQGITHYHARYVSRSSGDTLCTFSRLDSLGRYGFIHAPLSTIQFTSSEDELILNTGQQTDRLNNTKNTQWLTLLPDDVDISNPSEIAFECIAHTDKRLLAITWTTASMIDKTLMVEVGQVPNWIIHPEKTNPISLRMEQIQSGGAAVSFVESTQHYAGELPLSSHTPCGMTKDNNPLFLSVGLVKRQSNAELQTAGKQLLRQPPQVLGTNSHTQLFAACTGNYPTTQHTSAPSGIPTSTRDTTPATNTPTHSSSGTLAPSETPISTRGTAPETNTPTHSSSGTLAPSETPISTRDTTPATNTPTHSSSGTLAPSETPISTRDTALPTGVPTHGNSSTLVPSVQPTFALTPLPSNNHTRNTLFIILPIVVILVFIVTCYLMKRRRQTQSPSYLSGISPESPVTSPDSPGIYQRYVSIQDDEQSHDSTETRPMLPKTPILQSRADSDSCSPSASPLLVHSDDEKSQVLLEISPILKRRADSNSPSASPLPVHRSEEPLSPSPYSP